MEKNLTSPVERKYSHVNRAAPNALVDPIHSLRSVSMKTTNTSRRTSVASRSSFNSSAARGLASLAVAASLFGAAVPAFSQSDMGHPAETGHPPVMDDAARQKMSERMQARLDEMAKRLHIEPAQ